MRLLAPAILLAIPASAIAQSAPAAREFAEEYYSAALVASDAEAAFRREARRSLDASPQIIAAEKQRPGLRDAVVNAGAAAVRRYYAQQMPGIQERLATVISSEFDVAEQGALVAFLRSDAGRALRNAMRANLDTGKLADAVRTNPAAGSVTQDQLVGSIDMVGAVGALTPQQIAAVAAFNGTPTGQKFQRFTPRLLAMITEESNRLIQGGGAPVQQAMLLAMREHANTQPKSKGR